MDDCVRGSQDRCGIRLQKVQALSFSPSGTYLFQNFQNAFIGSKKIQTDHRTHLLKYTMGLQNVVPISVNGSLHKKDTYGHLKLSNISNNIFYQIMFLPTHPHCEQLLGVLKK
jgi:hypothetical protein